MRRRQAACQTPRAAELLTQSLLTVSGSVPPLK